MPAALPPASTTRRGINPSRFMGSSFAAGSGLEERVSLNERNITNLKNVIDLRKINTGKFLKPEDEENLEERLVNIADSLNILSRALNKRLILDKKVAAVDERNLKEKDKADAERKLERKKERSPGVFNKITAPVKGLFDNILRFLKNILIGSVLVKIFDWFNDPENENKIDEFAENLREKTKWIVAGLAGLLALNFVGPIMTMVRALRGLAWLAGTVAGWTIRQLAKPFGKKAPQGSGKGTGGGKGGFKSPIKRKVKVTQGSNWFKRGLDRINPLKGQGVTKGSNWFSRAKSKLFGGKSVTGSGIKPPVRSIPQASKVGWLKKIPFRNVARVLRVIGLGFLIAELKADWERGDTYAVIAKLTAYGAGWLVTTLGLAAGTGATATGVGTVPGLAVILGAGAAGAATDHYVRKMLLGNSSQPPVVQQNQNVVQSRKVISPSLTASNGAGNIQLLALGGGGGGGSVGGGGESGGGEETLPFFTSSDPNNMDTLTVRTVYGLVA